MADGGGVLDGGGLPGGGVPGGDGLSDEAGVLVGVGEGAGVPGGAWLGFGVGAAAGDWCGWTLGAGLTGGTAPEADGPVDPTMVTTL